MCVFGVMLWIGITIGGSRGTANRLTDPSAPAASEADGGQVSSPLTRSSTSELQGIGDRETYIRKWIISVDEECSGSEAVPRYKLSACYTATFQDASRTLERRRP